MSLKIFIIEDHPVMRQTLSGFIQSKPGLEVAGTAATETEALQRLAEVEANIVLIDVRLAGKNGLHLAERLLEQYPELLCLMLSGYGETPFIRHAFRVGARGYVLKGRPAEILEAIQVVSDGGTYLSPALQAKLHEVDG